MIAALCRCAKLISSNTMPSCCAGLNFNRVSICLTSRGFLKWALAYCVLPMSDGPSIHMALFVNSMAGLLKSEMGLGAFSVLAVCLRIMSMSVQVRGYISAASIASANVGASCISLIKSLSVSLGSLRKSSPPSFSW